jgi:hypothetical protein
MCIYERRTALSSLRQFLDQIFSNSRSSSCINTVIGELAMRDAIFLVACLLVLFVSQAHAETAEELWKSYSAAPDKHPNIPNCSFAGVFRGEKPLPTPPSVISVNEMGAKGDGNADDTRAFKDAIKKASEKGGAVTIGAGSYKLSTHLLIPDNVVLRGAGPEKTTLNFTRPLDQTVGPTFDNNASVWSWSGGMIWIGPADTFDASGKINSPGPRRIQAWEYWRPGTEITTVTMAALRGEYTLTVTSTNGLEAGKLVLMTWDNPPDASLLKHIAGHPSMESYNWNSATWLLPPEYPQWQWPVEIKSVEDNRVTLTQPLRVDIRPAWKVAFREIGTYVKNAGVENLRINLPSPHEHKHFKCVGFNGVLFNRAYNCWVKNVQITGAENPLIFSAAKNCTAEQLKIDGEQMNHHSIACRVNSHDNLVQNFSISGMFRVKHGINIEWLSSGNVYSKGMMAKGTFDSHRALSFDLIRTEITLANDADGPGGAGQAGPFIGARVAHWNIRVDGPRTSQGNAPGDFVFMPLTFPMGAFVGIQGAAPSLKIRDTVPGEKGSIIADTGRIPSIPNLYEAQLKLRLGGK